MIGTTKNGGAKFEPCGGLVELDKKNQDALTNAKLSYLYKLKKRKLRYSRIAVQKLKMFWLHLTTSVDIILLRRTVVVS